MEFSGDVGVDEVGVVAGASGLGMVDRIRVVIVVTINHAIETNADSEATATLATGGNGADPTRAPWGTVAVDIFDDGFTTSAGDGGGKVGSIVILRMDFFAVYAVPVAAVVTIVIGVYAVAIALSRADQMG